MMYRIFKISFVVALAIFSTLLTSCEKEGVLSDEVVQNFVDESVEAVERSGNVGRTGCYEFVFPISVTFPDGSSNSLEDYESLRATIKAWKEANPEAEEKPSLAFPLEVVSQESEILTVNSTEELKELKMACRRNGRKDHKKGDRCFKLVFPISISFPDGTITEFADKAALKTAIRTWKSENPEAEDKPMLAFPLDIELEDGTTVTIADAAALMAQKENCATGN